MRLLHPRVGGGNTVRVNNSKEQRTIRILLIEDNPGDVRLIRHLLGRSKNPVFEVRHEKSLRRGLERLKSGGIDVVLLDLELPDQGGFDTFFDARAAASDDVPIIVLTGSDLRPVVENSLRAHAANFLEKFDLDQEKLVKALQSATSGKRRQST